MLESNPRDQARLTATVVKGSAAFLNVLPTCKDYSLDDESMVLAVRHHLGLAPINELLALSCVCGASFAEDPDHAHSCVLIRSSSLTRRHDGVVQILAKLASEAGWHATIDDVEVPILRANLSQRAVAIAAGAHRVQLRYRPVAFAQGAGISSVAALVAGVGLVATRKRRP